MKLARKSGREDRGGIRGKGKKAGHISVSRGNKDAASCTQTCEHRKSKLKLIKMALLEERENEISKHGNVTAGRSSIGMRSRNEEPA